MLKVTDDGIHILLQQTSTTNPMLPDAIVIAVLVAINGILAFGLHLYSTNVSLLVNVMLIILSSGLYTYRKRLHPKTLSGGVLLLFPNGFSHRLFGRTTEYQLSQFDTVKISGNTLQITNNHKIVYEIQGFSEPRYLEVAQAVLEGKTIATQAKAIKLQSQ